MDVCVFLCCRLQQTFAAEGLQYSMGGSTGNTRNSHRLLAWAAAEHGLDKQNQLAEALFDGYFCKVRHRQHVDMIRPHVRLWACGCLGAVGCGRVGVCS